MIYEGLFRLYDAETNTVIVDAKQMKSDDAMRYNHYFSLHNSQHRWIVL